MRRLWYLAAWGLVTCTGESDAGHNPDCQGDACAQDSGGSESESDSDTADPSDVPASSTVSVSINVLRTPTDNRLRVKCDGREVIYQERFPGLGTHTWSAPARIGANCVVQIRDPQGGWLSGGTLRTCSKELASWPSERGLEAEVASGVMLACRPGCADPLATNYNPRATADDGTCTYIAGCTDPDAVNFDAQATQSDRSCIYDGFGVLQISLETDSKPTETTLDIRCEGSSALLINDLRKAWAVENRTLAIDAGHDCEIHVLDSVGDGGPSGIVRACGVEVANFDPLPALSGPWDVIVGNFRTRVCSGCTHSTAKNYDEAALVDDGSCTY